MLMILFSLLSAASHAKNLILTEDSPNYHSLGQYIELFEEKEASLSFNDLSSETFKWQPSDQAIINLGYTNSPYWYRLSLSNKTSQVEQRLLVIEYPPLDSVQIYWGNAEIGFSRQDLGRSFPFSQRKIKHRNLIQSITVLPKQSILIYLRIKTESAMQLPLSLWTKEAYIENEQTKVLIHGLYFGMTGIMLFYNLFLYISIRDKTYLPYIGSIFFVILVQASLRGFSFQYIFPETPLIEKYQLPITICLSGALLATFSIMFLELKKRSQNLYKTVYGVILVLLGIAVLSPFLGYSLSVRLSIVVTMLYSLIAVYSGIYVWRQGFKPASYFSIAYITFFTATILLSLNKLGILERNFLTEYAQEIGSGLEVVLLSFALAYRISILKKEKEQAQINLTVNLEKKIDERTAELNDTLNQLSVSNKRLARQNTEDSLSGVFNRRHFDRILANEWSFALVSQKPISLIMVDIDHFKKFNDLFGHVVGDECIKLVGSTMQSVVTRNDDMVFRYGGEEFSVILPATNIEGAKKIAGLICEAISSQKLLVKKQQESSVTISLGVATLIPTKEMKMEQIVLYADKALYRAKEAGRNQVVAYQST